MSNNGSKNDSSIAYYDREKRRNAEFIKPPNHLKKKVGEGGIAENILNKAQALLENADYDFLPLAEKYLQAMMTGIDVARKVNAGTEEHDDETVIAGIIYPAMQLKANGSMLHYPLVTQVAERLVHFLEVIERLDDDVIDIVLAYHTSTRAVVMGRVAGDGGQYGEELKQALNDACMRYFEKDRKRKQREEYSEDF